MLTDDRPEVLGHPFVREAEDFSDQAHSSIGQKYGDLPYSRHTQGVARRVARHIEDPEVVAAAHLHDTIEDTGVTQEQLALRFSPRTALLVFEVSAPEAAVGVRRAERTAAEAIRLAGVSADAKSIKCADVAENMEDIVTMNPGFARTYVPEKRALLGSLVGAHPELLREAAEAVERAEQALAALPPRKRRAP